MKSNNGSIKVALAILSLCCVMSGVNGQKSTSAKTLVIKTNIYCDHCMDCNDCSGKLVHDLSFVKGIKKNKLDNKAMTVSITYNPQKTTPEKIREAISKLGYDADDVKADSTAYSKLDGCCKKQ